jgi:hypothetical protein
MATDPTIRNLFGSTDESPKSTLDVNSIIRRSRARRLPRQLAAGSVFTLAIGGLAVASVQGIGALSSTTTTAAESSTMAEETTREGTPASGLSSSDEEFTAASEGALATSDASKRAPAEKINLCGGPLADVAPSESGLVLTVNFDDAKASADRIEGTVTLTNTGDATVSGTTGTTPAITLSQGGIVLWHTNGPSTMMARDVSLAPGESIDYDAAFSPVVCGVEDDSAELGFRADLPSVGAGEYQLSAAMDLLGDGDADLITGPLATVTLK